MLVSQFPGIIRRLAFWICVGNKLLLFLLLLLLLLVGFLFCVFFVEGIRNCSGELFRGRKCFQCQLYRKFVEIVGSRIVEERCLYLPCC